MQNHDVPVNFCTAPNYSVHFGITWRAKRDTLLRINDFISYYFEYENGVDSTRHIFMFNFNEFMHKIYRPSFMADRQSH